MLAELRCSKNTGGPGADDDHIVSAFFLFKGKITSLVCNEAIRSRFAYLYKTRNEVIAVIDNRLFFGGHIAKLDEVFQKVQIKLADGTVTLFGNDYFSDILLFCVLNIIVFPVNEDDQVGICLYTP